ncbi:MAG: PilZ domain-containing protein [Sandaracinaceae bacterium]
MPRRHVRFDSDLKATILTRPGDRAIGEAHVSNVSPAGLLLERLEAHLSRDSAVWVEIADATTRGRVGLIGRVVWTEDDRAGVDIEAMFPHHRDRFGDLLERLAFSELAELH